MQSTDEILDKVNDMTLSDALGVILANERTDLVCAFDEIQYFLLEMEEVLDA